MGTLDKLNEARQYRRPINFTYTKPDKAPGIRIGNPHAVFVLISKAGVRSTKVHIAQTSGVSDSQKPFPSFRMFDIAELSILSIIEQDTPFAIHADYNPSWEGYSEVICKV